VCADDAGCTGVLVKLSRPMEETPNAAMRRATVIAFVR
jgi:hypothetical protein